MASPSPATVEDFEEDDPYAPYTLNSSSSSSASTAPSTSSNTGASSSHASSASTDASTPSLASNSSTSSDTNPANSNYSLNTNRSEAKVDDVDDDEPLFGGRPFRDAHNSSIPTANTGNADPVTENEKEGLYAILNVEKDATEEQIRDAYKSLAIVLHPDKHQDPVRKSAAESRFRQVQSAYETLTDREKRAVYDYFGEDGLKSSWTVSVRDRTPAELQAEFEREARRKQLADAEALVKSKGDYTAHIDATALFIDQRRIPQPRGSFGPITLQDRLNRVGCTQLIGKHGFDTQVTNTTSVNFSGQMVSRGGMGGGNLVGTVKTHWSPRLFSEVTMTFLRPQLLTTKGQYTVDQNSFFTWQGTVQTMAAPPTFSLAYGQRLSSKSMLTGFTSVRSGTYTLGAWGRSMSSQALIRREPTVVAVGLTKQIAEGKGWTVQTSVSQVDQSISIDWSTKVMDGFKVRTGLNLGTGSGLNAFTNGERRLTENVKFGLGVHFGLPGGVTLRVRINRLGQKIVLPILLSPEFRSDLILLLNVIPTLSAAALHYFYLEPTKKKRISDRLCLLRKENRDLILHRRKAAIEGCQVLRDQAIKKAQLEWNKDGLVIVEAYYGRKESFPVVDIDTTSVTVQELYNKVWQLEKQTSSIPTTFHDDNDDDDEEKESIDYWDVRIPLQSFVNKSQLIVPGGRSKSNLLGFYDPILGERKHLFVRYFFRSQLHQVMISDSSPLAAPLRIHQL